MNFMHKHDLWPSKTCFWCEIQYNVIQYHFYYLISMSISFVILFVKWDEVQNNVQWDEITQRSQTIQCLTWSTYCTMYCLTVWDICWVMKAHATSNSCFDHYNLQRTLSSTQRYASVHVMNFVICTAYAL